MMAESNENGGAIDALIAERVGGVTPPDLTDRVLAEFERGCEDRSRPQTAPAGCGMFEGSREPNGGSRLLAAALLLLGLGVVTATLWFGRAGDGAAHSATAPDQATAPIELQQDPQRDPQQDPRGQQEPPGEPPPPEGAGTEPTGPCAIRLQVVDPHGGPVQQFAYRVLSAQIEPPAAGAGGRGQERLRALPGFDRRAARPRDFDADALAVAGLSPGRYRVVVDAPGFARSPSQPFVLTAPEAGEATPAVTVELNRGSSITGTITDAQGDPVADAKVTLESVAKSAAKKKRLPPEIAAWKEFAARFDFVSMLSDGTVRTDANGRFRFRAIALGTYTVGVQHRDFCPAIGPPFTLGAEPIEIPALELEVGTAVHGTVTLDGRPASEIRIRLAAGAAAPGLQPDGKIRRVAQTWTAISGDDGKFTFPTRVPAGDYTISCSELNTEGNPFQILLQLKESQVTFTIEPGTARSSQDLAITSNRRR